MSISSDSFLQVDPVLAALSEAAGGIQKDGPGRFSFQAGSEQVIKVTASVDEEWVLMDTPLTTCEASHWLQPGRLWKLLQVNAGLGGGAKFAVAGRRPSVRLRAEIPVDEETDPRERIRNARLGFESALARLRATKSSPSAERTEVSESLDPGASDARLQTLCIEAGWEISERPDGVVAVRLDVEDGYYQATVRGDNRESLSVWTELANRESWPAESWKALGAFLLKVSGHLRTVRAAVRHTDSGATAAGFEVVFDPPAGSEELGRAFSALSVACNLTRKEVRALRNEVVGKEYTAMVRGWSSKSGQSGDNQAQSGARRRGKT